MTLDENLELKVERRIGAPRDVVWRCWTEAELLKQWYCPRPWQVTSAELDVRPGGRMNCVMQGPTDERHDTVGCFLEVVPQQRLVFTDAYSEGFVPRADSFMTGYVFLSDHPEGGTTMVWGARHATAEQVKQHLDMGFEKGWAAAAAQLDELAKNLK
jgi:uncharacterized protein YndB with AHSA1/START domain